MSETLSIVPATPTDAELIESLARRIWPDAYGEILTAEQMEYMLKWMYSPDTIRQQMADGHSFLLAQAGGETIGFAGYSIKEDDAAYWKLHKLYLLPETQGKGYGKQLIETVYENVKNGGGKYLDLNVNRNNKAQFVYQKLGFTIIESGDFPIGNGYFMNDYIMRKVL